MPLSSIHVAKDGLLRGMFTPSSVVRCGDDLPALSLANEAKAKGQPAIANGPRRGQAPGARVLGAAAPGKATLTVSCNEQVPAPANRL